MQTLFTSGMITAECERIAAIIDSQAYVSIGTNSKDGEWYASVYAKGLLSQHPAKHVHGIDLAKLLIQAEEVARGIVCSATAADREWTSWFPADAANDRSAA